MGEYALTDKWLRFHPRNGVQKNPTGMKFVRKMGKHGDKFGENMGWKPR
jgi:hypothetical protein